MINDHVEEAIGGIMVNLTPIRSISFDTSFLLKDTLLVDRVVNALARDKIACFITSTVVSELEQLKIWGRITLMEHQCAIKRWRRTHATIIDFLLIIAVQ